MPESNVKIIPLTDVATHNDKKSAWIVIHDKVYDVTKFLEEVILIACKLKVTIDNNNLAHLNSIPVVKKCYWKWLAKMLPSRSKMLDIPLMHVN